MTLAEEQLYWMDKAREYADKKFTESTHEYIMQWQKTLFMWHIFMVFKTH